VPLEAVSRPTVVCVLLTADRPDMTRQAVEAFRSQTYPAKRLLVYDTGLVPFFHSDFRREEHYAGDRAGGAAIGELRNRANACDNADIIAHFDSDDWSHPNRIAEQVALLEASGSEAVGYNSCLFWREEVHYPECGHTPGDCPRWHPGEAWLYTSDYPGACVGSSLMYRRAAWERRHFDNKGPGEDTRWLQGVKSASFRSVGPHTEPRMVCRIHSGNTSPAYNRDVMLAVKKQGGEWKLAPLWNDYCQKAFM
jgi:hypothetical protein